MYTADSIAYGNMSGSAVTFLGSWVAPSSSLYTAALPSGGTTSSLLLLPANPSRLGYGLFNSGSLACWFLRDQPILESNLLYFLTLTNGGPNAVGPIGMYKGDVWVHWFGSGSLSGNVAYAQELTR